MQVDGGAGQLEPGEVADEGGGEELPGNDVEEGVGDAGLRHDPVDGGEGGGADEASRDPEVKGRLGDAFAAGERLGFEQKGERDGEKAYEEYGGTREEWIGEALGELAAEGALDGDGGSGRESDGGE